jgi:hypothetical protein
MKIEINVDPHPDGTKGEILITAHLFLNLPDQAEKIYYAAQVIDEKETLIEVINFVIERVIQESEINLPNY